MLHSTLPRLFLAPLALHLLSGLAAQILFGSVFNGNFSFNIDRDEIDVRENLPQGRKKIHRKHDATISYDDGTCTLSSGLIASDSVVRIWQGQVWRDRLHRYVPPRRRWFLPNQSSLHYIRW